MRTPENLAGHRFGRWVVVSFSSKQGPNAYWNCRCDCGTTELVCAGNLRAGRSTSCGCHRAEQVRNRSRTHGQAGRKNQTKEYRTWAGMIQRCTNRTRGSWRRYGGRGIRVCDRWNYFENFLADMGPAPSPKHSLDRHPNNDGNYEPGNCRWATASEQARNKGNSKREVA